MNKVAKFICLSVAIISPILVAGCYDKNGSISFSSDKKYEGIFYNDAHYTYQVPNSWSEYNLGMLGMSQSEKEWKISYKKYNDYIKKLEKEGFGSFGTMSLVLTNKPAKDRDFGDMIVVHSLSWEQVSETFGSYIFCPEDEYSVFSIGHCNKKHDQGRFSLKGANEVAEGFKRSFNKGGTCDVTENNIAGKQVFAVDCQTTTEAGEVRRNEVVMVSMAEEKKKAWCSKKYKGNPPENCTPFYQIDCHRTTTKENKTSCLDFVKHMEFKE